MQQFILSHNSWNNLIDNSVSFNLIERFSYVQFIPDTPHRLDMRHL